MLSESPLVSFVPLSLVLYTDYYGYCFIDVSTREAFTHRLMKHCVHTQPHISYINDVNGDIKMVLLASTFSQPVNNFCE